MRSLSELLKDQPITVRVEFFAASHGRLLLSVEGLFPTGDTRLIGIATSELTFETEPQRGTAVLEPVPDGFRLTIGPFSATAIAAQLSAEASLASVGLEVLPPLEAAMRIAI